VIIMATKNIRLKNCFQCGKPAETRHHVIPQEFKPIKNLTIPLCLEHKNITHTIVKQIYFPKHLRIKINKMNTQVDNLSKMLASVRSELDFNQKLKKKGIKCSTNVPIGDSLSFQTKVNKS